MEECKCGCKCQCWDCSFGQIDRGNGIKHKHCLGKDCTSVKSDDEWSDNALMNVEELASRFHKVYENELKRQGKKSKYSYFFSQLPKDIADLDRALARYVIEFVIPRCQYPELKGKLTEDK